MGRDRRLGRRLRNGFYERIRENVQENRRDALELHTSPASMSTADPWTHEVLAVSVLGLIEGRYFDICEYDRVGRALNELRKTLGMASFDNSTLAQVAALHALHCKRFAEMSGSIKESLPEAILTALGLDYANASELLGSEGWGRVQTRYEDPWPDPIIEEAEIAELCIPLAPPPRSAWQRFLRRPPGAARADS